MQSTTRRQILKAGGALAGGALVAGAYFVGRSQAAEFNYKLGLELRETDALPTRMLAACTGSAARPPPNRACRL